MEEENLLPPKPEEPLDSDCCGTGCVPCVFDIYENELSLWKKQCALILEGKAGLSTSENQKLEVICRERYQSYEIVSVVEQSKDIKQFRFALGTQAKLPLKIGQHLILRWTCPDGSLTRQYTPVSDCTQPGYFDVAIKIYNDGRMSDYVRIWEIGSFIEWRGPFGEFQYSPNKFTHLVLLAAGTGIAPMVQVIRHIVSNEEDETMIHLLYTNKHYTDLMCREFIHNCKEFWNFQVTYFVTQDTKEEVQPKYGDKVVFGRISSEEVRGRLPSDMSRVHFCICGTKSFDKDMIKLVKGLDFNEENYHKF